MANLLPFRSLQALRALDRDALPGVCQTVCEALSEGLPADAAPLLPRELTAVELSVALHRAFDFRRDRLVADASHPVLAHKVLTGRGPRLATLGRADGLALGMRRSESPFDAVTSALPGTGVSVGAGMATADRLRGILDRRIVVLLGAEGADMGQTLEALDRVGGTDTNLLVILNDDREAQPPSAGAVRRYVHRMRTLPAYREGKRELVEALGMVPFVGDALSRWAGSVKEAVANFLSPGHLFRELGWTYFGPEDGHDVLRLEQLLLDLHRVRGPVLLHLVTDARTVRALPAVDSTEGAASSPETAPASERQVQAVSGPTFQQSHLEQSRREQPLSEQPVAKQQSWTIALDEALRARMQHDPRIVCVRVAGAGGVPDGIEKARGIDAGPSPMHAVALAAGMAEMGLKPVVRIPASLGSRALDALRQEVVLPSLPVVIVLEGVGLAPSGQPHVLDDLGLWRPLHGLALPTPTDADDLAAHLRHALAMPSPSLMRLPAGTCPAPTGSADVALRPGRPAQLRQGDAIAIVATGTLVSEALRASDLLRGEGLEVAVVDARFVAPLDVAALRRTLRGARWVLVLEEHVPVGGFFESLVAQWPADRGASEDGREDGLESESTAGIAAAPVLVRLGVPARATTPGGQSAWRRRYGLDAEGIARAVRAYAKRAGSPTRA